MWELENSSKHLSAASEVTIDSLEMGLVTISAQVQRGWDQCGSLHTELGQGYFWDHQTWSLVETNLMDQFQQNCPSAD